MRIFYTGKVVSNWDPEGMGRVKVSLNGFTSEPGKILEGDWARLMTPASGQGRGFYWLPEVGDEVVVVFLGGPSEMLVLGCLYNGVETPPDANANGRNNIKKMHTRGHNELVMSDIETVESVELRTPKSTCEVELQNSSILPTVKIKAPVVELSAPAMIPPIPAPPAPPPVMPPPIPPQVTPTPMMPPAPAAPPPAIPPLSTAPPADADGLCEFKLDSRALLGPNIVGRAPKVMFITPPPPPPAPPPPPDTSAAPPPPPPTPSVPSTVVRLELAGELGPTITLFAPTIRLVGETIQMFADSVVGPVPTPPPAKAAQAAKAAIIASLVKEMAADMADKAQAALALQAVIAAQAAP